MVGVIFLLQSDTRTDIALVDLIVEKLGFKYIEMPTLSIEDFKNFSQNPEKFIERKKQILELTTELNKKIKKDWQTNYIAYPLYFTEQLEYTHNRTYYRCFKIECPLLERFKAIGENQKLEEFLEVDGLVEHF